MNYKVDAEKVAHFIQQYLKSLTVSGALVQSKVEGASGSIKQTASSSSESSATAEKKN